MKRLLPLVAALGLSLTATAYGEEPQNGSGTRSLHAIGLDLVRLIDNGQFEPDDGTLNFFYQGYLTKESAWTVGYAWGEESSIPEVTYKIYTQGYQNGPFWQLGLAVIDVDAPIAGIDYDNDVAVLGAYGYERSPAEHLVISGSVKALAGIDHPHTGEKDIVFLPSLSVMFTF